MYIGDVLLLAPFAQSTVLPVGLVGGEPGERHPGLDRALQHGLRLLRLGGELDLVGDVRACGTGPGPRSRTSADTTPGRSTPVPAGCGRPGTPRSDSCRPCRWCRCTAAEPRPSAVPFLTNPVSSATSTPAGSPIAATTAVRTSSRTASRSKHGLTQQPCIAVRCRVPGMLGQRPAVTPLQRRQQPTQILQRLPPDIRPAEPMREPEKELPEVIVPALYLLSRNHTRQTTQNHTKWRPAVAVLVRGEGRPLGPVPPRVIPQFPIHDSIDEPANRLIRRGRLRSAPTISANVAGLPLPVRVGEPCPYSIRSIPIIAYGGRFCCAVHIGQKSNGHRFNVEVAWEAPLPREGPVKEQP